MSRKINHYWSYRLNRRVVQAIGSRLYIDSNRNPKNSVFIAGTARSGTTWLAELISAQIPCRLMFEPFNCDLVSEYRTFHYFQYMRPEQTDKKLYEFARKVFNGDIRDPWIDKKNERIIPKFRLIKEIRANLLLKWLHDNFPEVPYLFIIRHPCAVVLSRMELGWATDRDIQPFISQQNLISDFLSDYIDYIKYIKSDEEKHAIIWCVNNLVPLKQFPKKSLKIIYYENLCSQPDLELSWVFKYIQSNDQSRRIIKAEKPSTTSKTTSAVVTGKDKISRWEKSLTTSQITKILKVVSEFGLDYLYGDSLLPTQVSG
jgi:hypothetical protein